MSDCDDPVLPCPKLEFDVAIPVVYPFQKITIPKAPVRTALDDNTLADDVDIDETFRSTFNDTNSNPPLEIVHDTATRVRVTGLGHAGVALVSGTTGQVLYFEYGRYDAAGFGLVREIAGPAKLSFDDKGDPTADSLDGLLKWLRNTNGGPYVVEGVYLKLPVGAFDVMRDFARTRARNVAAGRGDAYDIFSNHCFTFALEVVEEAGVNSDVSAADPLALELVFTDDANMLERGLARTAFAFMGEVQVPARQMAILQRSNTRVSVSAKGTVTPFTIPAREYE